MSKEQLANAIKKATEASENWARNGWEMKFGTRADSVNSLETAEGSDKKFVYRLEAIAYWKQVEQAGKDAAVWGRRALSSLEKGDITDADDSIYYAIIIEKYLNGAIPTWGPVYQDCKSVCGAA